MKEYLALRLRSLLPVCSGGVALASLPRAVAEAMGLCRADAIAPVLQGGFIPVHNDRIKLHIDSLRSRYTFAQPQEVDQSRSTAVSFS